MEEKDQGSRWRGQRALSTPIAAVVMLVVIVVAGVGGYYGLAAVQPSSEQKTSTVCLPISSQTCGNQPPPAYAHDISLYAPFPAAYTGTPIAFSAQLPVGETATSYVFNFGDGTNQTTTSPQATHVYANPGNYLVVVQGLVNNVWHDNYKGGLFSIKIAASSASAASGNSPSVVGKLLANSTTANLATGVLASSGGSIWVLGSYSGAPTNPVYVPQSPTMVGSTGLVVTSANQTSASINAQATASAPGIYTLTMVGAAVPATGATAYQNYTWTVIVPPTGVNGGTPVAKAAASGHKGQLIVYELAPGGSTSEDPAIAYDTVSYEPILNVYQTLIAYNGSQTGPTASSYVPEIATCVPGSQQCVNLYGTNLTDGTNFTFVISSAPQFYDPTGGPSSNGAHWGVWPTDVVFSVARTMSFATLPCWQCNNGWILTQSLLSAPSDPSWDGGVHAPANNTPQNVMAAVTINGTDCPTVAMTQQHGCVTFHANANGVLWPYFLELIADPLGGSIVSCGWYSAPAQGAGIPYWTEGNVSGHGDQPCAAMGSSPAWGADPSTLSPTAWDAWQLLGSGTTGVFQGNVQWNMVGSGPYYLASLTQAVGYTLQASPGWFPNPGCTWVPCQPQIGQYAASVSVQWENTETPGEQSYLAGIADFASIPATQAGFAIQLSQQGKIGITSFPSLSIYFFPFNLLYDTAGVHQWATAPNNIPGDFFSYVGMRQFFVTAYPYQTIQQTISTKNGIQYLFNYGGVIPQFMANYYPTNISWPSGDPSVNCASGASSANGPLCAQWWWSQLTNSGSQYYDPEAAACTPSTPCQLVTFGQLGAPDLDQRFALWNQQIATWSGGAIQVTTTDLTFHNLVVLSLFSGPGNGPLPMFNLGWAPDYPDPTDYVGPMYGADATYTYTDAVQEQLTLPTFDAASCGSSTNYGYWSSAVVGTNCQGAAYEAMLTGMADAAVTAPGPQRVLIYNMVENIANKLALYGYYGQANEVYTYASWIDSTTINTNPTIGGGGDIPWFMIGGTNVY